MNKIELTEKDFYVLIEALNALKNSAEDPRCKILLSKELKTVKRISAFIEDNNIFIANQWLLNELLKNKTKSGGQNDI